jgi:hypothetical protein
MITSLLTGVVNPAQPGNPPHWPVGQESLTAVIHLTYAPSWWTADLPS